MIGSRTRCTAMDGYRRYIRKENEFVVAVRIDLDTEGFRYNTRGREHRCGPGDWIVHHRGDTYTLDDPDIRGHARRGWDWTICAARICLGQNE